MQRADKIGLIVASVLVLVLLAGGGYLLYVRSATLGAERPADTAVKLVTLEDKTTAPATVAPAPAPKPVLPKKPKGSDFGYVTNVSGSGKDLALRWDQADLLTGSEADLYAKKNGAVVNTKLYYVANDTHKTKTYGISSSAQIEITAADRTVIVLNASEFAKQWAADGTLRKAVWWLYARGDSVYKLQQVVLPSANL